MPTREDPSESQTLVDRLGFDPDEADKIVDLVADGILTDEQFQDLLDDGEINGSVPGSDPVDIEKVLDEHSD